MSTFFTPDSGEGRARAQPPQPAQQQPVTHLMEKRPMVVGAVVSILVVLGGWLAWTPASEWGRSLMGRHHADAALVAMEKEDWLNAFQSAYTARRWAPDDLEVLHKIKRLLAETGADPVGLIQVLQKIEVSQKLSVDDQIALARAYIAAGKPQEARAVHEGLPAAAGADSEVLAIQARVLRAEGHVRAADEISRKVLEKAPESPAAEFSQAEKDLASTFPEMQNRAWQRLWALARTTAPEAMLAVTRLTIKPDLTAAEAAELKSIVDGHPHQGIHVRLGVVSALARLTPEKKAAYLRDEIRRFKEGSSSGDLEAMARWLALEKEHDLVIELIPLRLASSSRVLYPILAQSFAEQSRWVELKKMLTSGRPPVSPSRIALWLAEAEAHLDKDGGEARRQLETGLESARREQNQAALLAIATTAEKLGHTDVAVQACMAAATGEDSVSLELLQKAASLAQLSKDTRSLIAVTRRLTDLRPSSTVFAGRLAYLQLLLGLEMESAVQATEAFSSRATADDLPLPLLQTLADHRLGRSPLREFGLSSVPSLDRLPPGQRAVAAGLLQMAGHDGLAFQIAEKIPETLLLDEEKTFLHKAR